MFRMIAQPAKSVIFKGTHPDGSLELALPFAASRDGFSSQNYQRNLSQLLTEAGIEVVSLGYSVKDQGPLLRIKKVSEEVPQNKADYENVEGLISTILYKEY